jgi:uncharacterized protein YndB with AHSA1/START domain
MKKTDEVIIVEQLLNSNVETVWKLITEVTHMQKWFFENIPNFEAEEGFETNFIVDAGERSFDHRWRIIAVDPQKKISYDWRYEGYNGAAIVHFSLFPNGDSTMLKFTCEITEDFPQDVPEFKRESCIGGWNYFLKESLPKYLKSLN